MFAQDTGTCRILDAVNCMLGIHHMAPLPETIRQSQPTTGRNRATLGELVEGVVEVGVRGGESLGVLGGGG